MYTAGVLLAWPARPVPAQQEERPETSVQQAAQRFCCLLELAADLRPLDLRMPTSGSAHACILTHIRHGSRVYRTRTGTNLETVRRIQHRRVDLHKVRQVLADKRRHDRYRCMTGPASQVVAHNLVHMRGPIREESIRQDLHMFVHSFKP